jgi:hypothetical protein
MLTDAGGNTAVATTCVAVMDRDDNIVLVLSFETVSRETVTVQLARCATASTTQVPVVGSDLMEDCPFATVAERTRQGEIVSSYDFAAGSWTLETEHPAGLERVSGDASMTLRSTTDELLLTGTIDLPLAKINR